MTDEDRYIPGVPCWIDTAQPDPAAAAAFYGELFGWEIVDATPPGAPGTYAIARLRGGDVAAVSSPAPAAVWNSYVWVADADATAAKGRAAGGSVLAEAGEGAARGGRGARGAGRRPGPRRRRGRRRPPPPPAPSSASGRRGATAARR